MIQTTFTCNKWLLVKLSILLVRDIERMILRHMWAIILYGMHVHIPFVEGNDILTCILDLLNCLSLEDKICHHFLFDQQSLWRVPFEGLFLREIQKKRVPVDHFLACNSDLSLMSHSDLLLIKKLRDWNNGDAQTVLHLQDIKQMIFEGDVWRVEWTWLLETKSTSC